MLNVLEEGPHHVVVDKPAGLVVVRARGVPGPTLLDLVVERFGNDARPVHRLDRVTTGACLFAKTLYGQQALSEAFRTHKVDKRYLALVEGAPAFERIAVDARLLRIDAPEGKRGAQAWQSVDERGQRARTELKVLARGEGVALLLAQPQTGRMHQIRAHCAHVGHPIVGDALYGASTNAVAQGLDAHQVALHALAVAFPRPDGGRSFLLCPPEAHFLAAAKATGIDVERAIAPVVESFTARAAAPPPPAPPTGPKPRAGGARRGSAGPRGGKPRSAPSRRGGRRGR